MILCAHDLTDHYIQNVTFKTNKTEYVLQSYTVWECKLYPRACEMIETWSLKRCLNQPDENTNHLEEELWFGFVTVHKCSDYAYIKTYGSSGLITCSTHCRGHTLQAVDTWPPVSGHTHMHTHTHAQTAKTDLYTEIQKDKLPSTRCKKQQMQKA